IRERVLGKKLDTRAILRAALTGEHRDGHDDGGTGVPVEVRGALVNLLAALRDVGEDAPELRPIKGLVAELRPYQEKGVSWLRSRAAVGAGACLADDMGLGKTLQLIAFLLARREEKPKDTRPILVVAPTSVLGNWEREINRFAPSLTVLHHYGPSRATKATALQRQSRVVFITSYGVLRRDADLLSDVDFSTVILDEAQNIKNPGSASARAARALTATHRFALTGTPVENRLTELWSILEFAMPGLLGSLQSFRRDIAGPVERRSDPMATERLRRLIGPFLLRRLKSDPLVIKDLPPKNEMTVLCSLTKEQATLYAAVVREELSRVEEAEGLARRGRILALLTALKQVCNHPVQYMRDAGPLIRRSGKLTRLLEMLEEALAEGDKVLVFTQYREMGDLLSDAIEGMLGVDTMFLHGGTPRRERERMVKTFQEDADAPKVFLLSLKAGGTGLNLTAACRVFHFDRWWNPAVEDQATDRAYRIGQTRTVQVHKLVCQGTLEEKIDALLVQKRGLADRVVGGGEEWLTELSNSELAELVSLSAGDLDLDDDEDPTASADESDSEVAEVTVSQDMSPRAMRQKPGSRKRGSS
ncbi:MAG: DEAD/DEAH box helicase, partial [Acidobacteria bacterium]|nr:DEAD/DEAH box helicase [Acidobacteriota bacterium]